MVGASILKLAPVTRCCLSEHVGARHQADARPTVWHLFEQWLIYTSVAFTVLHGMITNPYEHTCGLQIVAAAGGTEQGYLGKNSGMVTT